MFKKTVRDIRGEEYGNTPEVPDNLMRKCNACKAAVFAGGDAVTGAATVILAMGAGKAGAKGIDEYLSGK